MVKRALSGKKGAGGLGGCWALGVQKGAECSEGRWVVRRAHVELSNNAWWSGGRWANRRALDVQRGLDGQKGAGRLERTMSRSGGRWAVRRALSGQERPVALPGGRSLGK